MKTLLTIVLILIIAPSLQAQTPVEGVIDGEVWTEAGSPYVLMGDLEVASLEIQPNVRVEASGHFHIAVTGYLNAIGTEESPVVFTVADGVTAWGGIGISHVPSLQSQFIHCQIEHSTWSGLWIIDSVPPVLEHCNFNDNTRTGGGAIYVENTTLTGTTMTLLECSFADNHSTSSHGGALRIELIGGELNIDRCTFTSNIANVSTVNGNFVAGAVYMIAGNLNVMSSTFTGNRSNSRCSNTFDCSVTARGGAIYLGNDDATVFENCHFESNLCNAVNAGNCFFGGSSRSYGAAVYVQAGDVEFHNCLFVDNTTPRTNCGPSDGGGGVYVNGGTASLYNCNVVENPDATGLHQAAGWLEVENSIIFDNNGGSTQIGGTTTTTYSCVQDGYLGEGNIADNPTFIDDDYHLSSVSLCVDGGNPDHLRNDHFFPPSKGTVRNDMGMYGGPGASLVGQPLIAVTDQPDDQGGEVVVSWPSFPDEDPDATQPIVTYALEQASYPFVAETATWTLVSEVPATGAESYEVSVSPLETHVVDESWPYYVFRVIGLTNDPGTEFPSNTGAGMAIDNIAPPAPTLQISEQLDVRQILMLTPDLTDVPDFDRMCVYRGGWNRPGQIFFPTEATLWDEASLDPSCTDITTACADDPGPFHSFYECHRNHFYYIAKTIDIHGNASAASDSVYSSYPTDAPDSGLPAVTQLDNNYPNPFNPSTTIKYSLARSERVTLRVYDLAGRVVRELVHDVVQPEGTHEISWEGRDGDGRAVASGTYICQLLAGEHVESRRMTLLK